MQVRALERGSMPLDVSVERGGSTPPLRTTIKWRNHWETRGSALVVSGSIPYSIPEPGPRIIECCVHVG